MNKKIINIFYVLWMLFGGYSSNASLEFNGKTTYTIIDDSFLNGSVVSEFTFDFWINPADITQSQSVWSKTEYWKEMSFGISNGKLTFFHAWPETYYSIETSLGVIKSNQWQHIVIVGDGVKGQFYVNGAPVPTSGRLRGEISFAAIATQLARGPMVWGLRDNTTLPDDNWYKGLLSSFRVWDRALTELEIATLHVNSDIDNIRGLRHYFPLNETAGTTMTDIIGGIIGKLYGNVEWNSNDPILPSSRTAKAKVQIVNGFIVDVVMTDFGFGYTNAPLVQIRDPKGYGMIGHAVVRNGMVVDVVIDNPGKDYSNETLIIIAAPPSAPKLDIGVSKVLVTASVVLGRKYLLESSFDLKTWNSNWLPFIAENNSVSIEFDVNVTGRYFRIQEIP